MTLAAIRAQVDFSDTQEIIRFSSTVDIQWDGQRVLLKGEDVSAQIRTPPVTDAIRFVADLPEIRSRLSEIQRQVSTGRNMVTEGRDQGSEVFSDAECKIFLTASPEECEQTSPTTRTWDAPFHLRKSQELKIVAMKKIEVVKPWPPPTMHQSLKVME